MAKYRTAIVGARRGIHHARAYHDLKNMEVVALCEIDQERRENGEKELGVKGYANYEEMLDKEKPDIVHAVTMPTVPRYIWVEPAAKAGVKTLVIEKPIALRPKELEALDTAQKNTGLKIIVNHQRRFMPFSDKVRELRGNELLGCVHFVRASTQGEITDMDTHLMDLVLLSVGDVPANAVWATVHGAQTYEHAHLNCPENMIANYTFSGGIRVLFESTREALGTADFPNSNPRCNIDIWADNGRMWWRENGSWGYQIDGMAQQYTQPTNFGNDDMPAQIRFTQAVVEWLDDESKKHHCRYELAKMGTDAVMAAYRSALLGSYIKEPGDSLTLTDAEWEELRDKVMANG
jgi:predicted dehydrogenase